MDASALPPRESWPPHAHAQELFRRLVALDPLAPWRVAAAYLEPLVAHLRRSNPVHEHLLNDAAEDAIMSLVKRPEQYDPARGSLENYLCMAAVGDLRNALRREGRHHRTREYVDPVELGEIAGKTEDESDDDAMSFDHPALAAVIADFDDGERAAFGLMRDGVRDTTAFAAALGVADRSDDDQFVEVKRVKDRIKARLKRAAEGL